MAIYYLMGPLHLAGIKVKVRVGFILNQEPLPRGKTGPVQAHISAALIQKKREPQVGKKRPQPEHLHFLSPLGLMHSVCLALKPTDAKTLLMSLVSNHRHHGSRAQAPDQCEQYLAFPGPCWLPSSIQQFCSAIFSVKLIEIPGVMWKGERHWRSGAKFVTQQSSQLEFQEGDDTGTR